MPIFAHPRFGPQKKPVFCLRSKVLGMLPTCFFVFFYIDFVFFFMIFAYFPIFCQIFCLRKRKLADFGSNLLCFWWSSHANFADFSDLYGWNYPAHPPVWLKLSCTPFCTVEITQHTPCMVEITQYALCMVEITQHAPCMVEITQHALKGQKLLAQGNALGIRQSAMRPVRAKALKYT